MARTHCPAVTLERPPLVERRDEIPPVDLDVEESAEVDVADSTVIEAPGLNIELEDDGGVVVDFDPRMEAPDTGDFYDNLAETIEDRVSSMVSSSLWSSMKPTRTVARIGKTPTVPD